MIIDGRRTSGLPKTEYDLVIVGAGPAGITLAHELRQTGIRIALLESGGEEYDDETQLLNDGRLVGHDAYDLMFSRLRYLGGTSNHWGGHCTPLDQIDFDRSWAGFSGWPFSRSSMDKYYEKAHKYCDLGAYTYSFQNLAPKDRNLQFLPDEDELETAILRQSSPTRFGDKYQNVLAESSSIHLWLWTNATRVSTSTVDGEWVETKTLLGIDRRFSAKAVVIAGGTIEATRLLLWSNAQNETSVGDTGNLLGRCFMDHPSGGAGFLHFNKPQGDKIYWADIDTFADDGVPLFFVWRFTDAYLMKNELPNSHFFVIPFADNKADQEIRRKGKLGLRSLKSIVKWGIGRDVGARFDPAAEFCNAVMSADEFAVSQFRSLTSGGKFTRALLKYEAEQRPDKENWVRLSSSNIDPLGVPQSVVRWAPSSDDLAAVRVAAVEIGRLAGANGLGRVQLESHNDHPYWNTSTAWHQLGTMRMAESPTSGVTDVNARVNGAGQLFVASGALFPSAGRANPTLTIVALSIKLADHIKELFDK